MYVYSITESFSPILYYYCRPDVVTLERFCLYNQCSHLNLSTLFHLRWMLRRFRCAQILNNNPPRQKTDVSRSSPDMLLLLLSSHMLFA